jgi:hypothetical protein
MRLMEMMMMKMMLAWLHFLHPPPHQQQVATVNTLS